MQFGQRNNMNVWKGLSYMKYYSYGRQICLYIFVIDMQSFFNYFFF